jgi:positive regulator of sigma E activity
MLSKTKQVLITAEIIGFFLIVTAVLGMITGRRVFIVAVWILFFMIVLLVAAFAVFATLAVKQEKGTWQKHRKTH